jgi:hypothetical protein
MKEELLRSIFIAKPTDNADLFLENFRDLDQSRLEFEDTEMKAVWVWVKDFVYQHKHVPAYTTLQGHFRQLGSTEVVDRLPHLAAAHPLTRGDYRKRIEDYVEDHRRMVVKTAIEDASKILTSSLTIKDGGDKAKILRGPIDAMRYLMDKAHDVVTPATGSKLSGDVTSDGDDFMAEYDRVKLDPLAGIGCFTGVEQMDAGLKGAKRNELWIHAAFTGHLKSTLMMNWAYNQAIWYGHDVLIISLEMPYIQCRRILYAMHSCHPKFASIHKPVDYQQIRDGQLTPETERFLRDVVVPDFNNKVNGYGSIHIEVADPDKVDYTVADIKARAEVLYTKHPFSMMVIDHALLVAPRKWVASTTERINEVIRDCKRMAMSFNRGAGMAVVLLFQISREGYKAALKAREGGSSAVYNLTFLSYANEAERSADIVTSTWIDPELSKNNQFIIQCLKSRDQQPFEPFRAGIVWQTRRIMSIKEGPDANPANDNLDGIAEGVEA